MAISKDGDCTIMQQFLSSDPERQLKKIMVFINGTGCSSGIGDIKIMRMYTASPLFFFFLFPSPEFAGDALEKEHHISIHREYTAITTVRKEIF